MSVRRKVQAVTANPRPTGRNAPCPCGSGRKAKACCATNSAGQPDSAAPQPLAPALQAFHDGQFDAVIALTDSAASSSLEFRIHYLRGRSFKALGQLDLAVESYRRAIGGNASFPDAWISLGIAQRAKGRLAEAVDSYRRAIEIAPGAMAAWLNLGNVQLDLRRFDEAERAYREAAAAAPDNLLASLRHGIALRYVRDLETASRRFDSILLAVPDHPDALIQKGLVLEDQGQEVAAMDCYERVLGRDASNAGALYRKANLLRLRGDLDAADAVLGSAMRCLPADPDAAFELGTQLLIQDRFWEAAACFQRVLELAPLDALAWSNLGQSQRHSGLLDAAERSFRRAIEIQPDFAMPWQGLGAVEVRFGRLDAALYAFRRAYALDPEFVEAYSSELLTLNYQDEVAPSDLFGAHERFGRRFAQAARTTRAGAAAPRATGGAPEPVGRLRVGFVSPDLRRHSVAYFLEPLLEHRDRARMECICYNESPTHDAMSERLKATVDGWRSVSNRPLGEIGQQIADDRIDLLIDLAGHAGRSPRLFFNRWAPVQLTFLGYPTTTGLPTIDYRISDWMVDPPGAEAHGVERPLRLPGSYFCYRPPDVAAEINHPDPASDEVVFGSFNNLAKVSDRTLRTWQRCLARIPGSRLVLKNLGLDDADSRARLLERLAGFGFDAARVELAGWRGSMREHLETYRRVDVALDTGPYNGATTTCEALWMGVPVVSLVGSTHASRMGLSILTAAGMDDCVVSTEDDFVTRCEALVLDLPRLRRQRADRRATLSRSRLMDGSSYARDFADLLVQAWRESAGSAMDSAPLR